MCDAASSLSFTVATVCRLGKARVLTRHLCCSQQPEWTGPARASYKPYARHISATRQHDSQDYAVSTNLSELILVRITMYTMVVIVNTIITVAFYIATIALRSLSSV